MKITVVTEGWPTKGTDSIYLNSTFKKEAYNYDISIITTSKDGFGTKEGIHNIIEHRVESIPRKANKLFFDEVCKILASEPPDICITLTPSHHFFPSEYCKFNVAHWTSNTSSADIKKDITDRYDIHTTFEEKHKLRLVALGVPEGNIFVASPITTHTTMLTVFAKASKTDLEDNLNTPIEVSLKPVLGDYICFIDKNITVRTTPWYKDDIGLDSLENIRWHDATLVAALDLQEHNIVVPEEYRSYFFDLNENLKLRYILQANKYKTTIPIFAARIGLQLSQQSI
jgi:hypothetical protein